MDVVFVYGTLTDDENVSQLLNEFVFGPEVTCEGLERIDGRYPTLAPGERVVGRLLATAELDRLDSYEGVDRGWYCRCSVPVESTQPTETTEPVFAGSSAELYIGDPTALGVSQRITWPGAGSFTQRVQRYLETNNVKIIR